MCGGKGAVDLVIDRPGCRFEKGRSLSHLCAKAAKEGEGGREEFGSERGEGVHADERGARAWAKKNIYGKGLKKKR